MVLQSLATRLADMPEDEIGVAHELLAYDDQELWDMLVARNTEPAAHLRDLVASLR